MIQSFLMIGQSNMAGRGFINEVPPIYNEKIQMLRNGRWQMMTEPINYDRPVSGISLTASFADTWCKKFKEKTIGLIPCAEGGSSIDEWNIDGILYKHAISEAKFAMQTSNISGILWHQGESDSYNESYKSYKEKLFCIFENLRKDLNLPNTPIIVGGLCDFLGKVGFGKNCTEYTFINQELKSFAFEYDNCYFVTGSGLTSNPDGIHIDAISQRKFGLRYFEAFYNKKHILKPLPNEDELIKNISSKTYTKKESLYISSMDLALGKISYDEFETKLASITKE